MYWASETKLNIFKEDSNVPWDRDNPGRGKNSEYVGQFSFATCEMHSDVIVVVTVLRVAESPRYLWGKLQGENAHGAVTSQRFGA